MQRLVRIEARVSAISQKLTELFPPVPAKGQSAEDFHGILTRARATAATAAAGDYDTIIKAAAHEYQLDPDLVHAVIRAESGYDPLSTSSAGAQGLMQLMPQTGATLGVTDPYDPEQNVRAGARYLSGQLRSFGDLELALAAYNAGPGAVRRYSGIPPYAETQQYVQRVLRYLDEQKTR